MVRYVKLLDGEQKHASGTILAVIKRQAIANHVITPFRNIVAIPVTADGQ
jgi:hypothetical protein